jgi:hypothetical protein
MYLVMYVIKSNNTDGTQWVNVSVECTRNMINIVPNTYGNLCDKVSDSGTQITDTHLSFVVNTAKATE